MNIGFVESNTTTGARFVNEARRLGLRPRLLAKDPSFYQAKLDCEIIEADTSDPHEIAQICWQYNIGGLTTTSDFHSWIAAKAAELCDFPGPRPEAIFLTREKDRQRSALAARGIPQPAFQMCNGPAAALKFQQELQGQRPIVLKPVVGSGKVGVRLVKTRDQLAHHAQLLAKTERNQRGHPVPPRFLAEEYVEGPEFSAEVFNGKLVTVVQKYSFPPTFIEEAHLTPARIRPDCYSAIEAVAENAASALGLTWGPIHVELKLTKTTPVIIEVNPRLAGGHIPSIVELTTGRNLIRETLKLAAGIAPDVTGQREYAAAAIGFLVANEPGTVESIQWDTDVCEQGVVEKSLYITPGTQLTIHGDFRDRVGHVVTHGASPEEAIERAQRVINRAQLTVAADMEGKVA